MDQKRERGLMVLIRPAGPGDTGPVVELMADFYAEDNMPFDRAGAHRAVARLVGEPELGRIWVAGEGDRLVGYAVLTLGFSLEYMGVDGFLDDLYVVPGCRGRGVGTRLLEALTRACPDLEVRALHLEVGRHKTAARDLYSRLGFEDHDRLLMTRIIGGAGS